MSSFGQTIPIHRAVAIFNSSYPGVMPETVNALIRSGELRRVRVGYVDRVSLADIQRILQSWTEQKAIHAQRTPMQVAVNQVQAMSNQELQTTWFTLANYDPQEYWDHAGNISMDDWANLIYGEMDRRRIPHY